MEQEFGKSFQCQEAFIILHFSANIQVKLFDTVQFKASSLSTITFSDIAKVLRVHHS